MIAKIVNSEEYDIIHAQIMSGENIPRTEKNGYKVENYLPDKYLCQHPNEDLYYILKDDITQQYCTGFQTLSNDWFTTEEI